MKWGFEVGDIVEVRAPMGVVAEGTIGRVVTLSSPSGMSIGISFEGWHGGHNLRGIISDHSGYYVFPNQIQHAEGRKNNKRIKTLPFELGMV